MANIIYQLPLKTLFPVTAVLGAGVTTGFLSAVAFLDIPTFHALVDKKEADTIKKLFPIWWPNGKAFMQPSLAFNLFAHLGSYYVTNEKLWILTAGGLSSIGLYTGLFMMEDIDTLMGNKAEIKDDDVYSFTKSFCRSHYPRLFLSLFSFGTSLYLLTK